MSLVYYSSYPYYPCRPGDLGRLRWRVTVIVIVVVLAAAVAGWTPPEILRLLALLLSGA
jgi:hypothetical protein